MTIAITVEPSAESVLGPPGEPASQWVQRPRARKCRCADAEVKAYREDADWICHTCGYEIAGRAAHQLIAKAQTRDRARRPSTATQLQRPLA